MARNLKKHQKIKSARAIFKVLGIDTTGISEADLLHGAELARRISQCESVSGSCKRRPAAIAQWREFINQIANRSERIDEQK